MESHMKDFIRTADSRGRVALPGFANATLLIEKVDDTEYRVRKIIPARELLFHEEDFPVNLSKRDAAKLMRALENPPPPNAAARRAARRFAEGRG
jgi:hypothetical protein